jgi:hypothetical protein
MHSLNHVALGQAVAADRARPLPRGLAERLRHRPPPIRSRAASWAAQLAHRLDAEAARRAVA